MRSSLIALISLWAILLTAGDANAQSARSYLTADSITVGDRFSLVIVAEMPANSAASFGLDNLGDLVAVGRPIRQAAEIDGMIVDSVIVPVTTFAIDTLTVPPLAVTIRADADSTVVFSDGLIQTVASLLSADTQDIIDITDIEPFPRKVWPWLLAVLGLIGAFLLYRRLAANRKPIVIEVPPEPELPPPSPLKQARARLAALREFDLSEAEGVKDFFVELSDVLRTYIEHELGIPALETTTGELAVLARRSPDLGDESLGSLEEQLRFADMVKFSDVRPPRPRSHEALDDAGSWIEEVAASLIRRNTAVEVGSSGAVLVSTAHSGNGQVASS